VIMTSKSNKTLFVGSVLILFLCTLMLISPSQRAVQAQQPTGSIATVTGTASGAIVSVDLSIKFVEVYSGPSTYLYPSIGILIAGQQVPALGYSQDQTWLKIYYPGVTDSVGWVYGPFVKVVKQGSLPILDSPPTPTPASTPTINPTLAAAFIAPVTPTRLVTFTVPAPLVLPSFDDQTDEASVPIGLLIFGLGFIGGLGVLISFLRGR
jgi:uncharacterized protein YraI